MESFDITKDLDQFKNLKPMFWAYDLSEPDPVTNANQHIFSDVQSLMLDLCFRNFEIIKASIDKGENQYQQSDLDAFKFVPVRDNLVVNIQDMKLVDTVKNQNVCDVYKLDSKSQKKSTFFDNNFTKPQEMCYNFKKWGWLGKQFLVQNIKLKNIMGLPSWRQIKDGILVEQIL